MRLAAWLLPFALLVAAGSVAAQVAAPAFQVSASPTSSTVAPGNSTQLEIQATRICPTATGLLDEQTATLVIQHQPEVAVASVGQVLFRSQMCASQPEQAVLVAASITIPSDYNGSELLDFRIELEPHPASGPNVGSSGEGASVTYVLRVERSLAVAAASGDEQPPLEAPAIPAILLAVALLVGAFALRRRR